MSQYYYTDGKERFGPFTLQEFQEKGILANTLVWRDGLPDWIPASQLPELSTNFGEIQKIHEVPPPHSAFSPTGKPPKNWLLESILVTFLCCMPLGIMGIVYATKVDTLWYAGKHEEAHKEAQQAAKWAKFGAVIGFIFITLFFILILTGVFANILLPK